MSTLRDFLNRVQMERDAVVGQVTGVTRDSTTGRQSGARVSLGEATLDVNLDALAPELAPGDYVRLENYGASTLADWRVAAAFGARPAAGVLQFLDTTPIGEQVYAPGDILIGGTGSASPNWWFEYASGTWRRRVGPRVLGLDEASGRSIWGPPDGVHWELDPNRNTLAVKNGSTPLYTFDGDTGYISGWQGLGRPLGPGIRWGEIPQLDAAGGAVLDAAGQPVVRYAFRVIGLNGVPVISMLSGDQTNPDEAYLRVGAAGATRYLEFAPDTGLRMNADGITVSDPVAPADALNLGFADGRYERVPNAVLTSGARTGASSQAQTFTSGIVGPSWKPAADSTTALQVQNAAGTLILNVDTTNGRVGFGIAAPSGKFDCLLDSNGGVFRRYAAAPLMAFYRANGALGAETAVGSADSLGVFGGYGWDGSAYTLAAAWYFESDNTVSAGNVPGRIKARIRNAAGTLSYPFAIRETGFVGFGTDAPTTQIHGLLTNSTTNAVDTILTLDHLYAGATAAGFGSAIALRLRSSTTSNRGAARVATLWNVATDASRSADLVLYASDYGAERELFRARGTGTAGALTFYGGTPVVRGAALTTQLTTITHTAPGTPDYAVQALTAGGYGFVTADEGHSVLAAIVNLQARCAELEARLGSATGCNLFA